ncbi:MAG: C-type lectin domain-containing protein, partial [Myxococcales bacterium]|nr:C-type lectin domain-containing protein [Myxococcales bacterium]
MVDHGPSRLVTWTGGCLGTGADTVLGVYPLGADDAPGEAVARDDDGGAGACSRLDLDLAPGRYLLRVQGFGAAPAALDRYTLDYRLTVDARVRGRFAGQYAPSGDDRFRFAIPERSGFACGDRASCLASTGCRLLGGETGTYLHCPVASSWTEARDFCAAQGGQLATIDSAAENDFLVSLTAWGWIGLNDRTTENQFLWADGSAFRPADYDGFSDASTNAAARDCVVMRQVGGWLHRDCANNYGVVCEAHPTLQTRVRLETGDGAGACVADTDTVLRLYQVGPDGTRTQVATNDDGGV